MRTHIPFSVLGVIALGLATAQAHDPVGSTRSHLHGTSIFHWKARTEMHYVGDNQDLSSLPMGVVSTKHNRQGRADNQRFSLLIRHLEPETSYHLLVRHRGETELTAVTEFQASRRGSALLKHKKIGSREASNSGVYKFRLPDLLSPIEDIEELAVADAGMNLLLTTDLSHPDRYQILVKRELDNPGVDEDAEGVIRLRAHPRKGYFLLYLAGLDVDTDYRLVLNGEVVGAETLTSAHDGTLANETQFLEPRDVLDLRSIELWNELDEVVLETTLP